MKLLGIFHNFCHSERPGTFIRSKFWVMCLVTLLMGSFISNLADTTDPALVASSFGSGPITEGLKNLTEKLGFPFQNIGIVDFSGLSQPNAYLKGVLDRKIQISASLVRKCEPPSIIAAVGHELGHWKHNDSIFLFFYSLIPLIVHALLIQFVRNRKFVEFGLGDDHIPFSLVILYSDILYSAFKEIVVTPTNNIIIRNNEYRADCFAMENGLSIGESLKDITKATRTMFTSNPMFNFFYEDHPSLERRLLHLLNCRTNT